MEWKPIILVAGLIAVLLFFGCTMPNLNNKKEEKPTGYSVSVTPREIVPGGVSTIKFTISNTFERKMQDVTINVGNVPGDFAVNYVPNVGDIYKGDKRPQVITITAPSDVSMSEVITPKISVCFNYKTDFYQDLVFNTFNKVANITAHSGSTYGPVSVSFSNNMMYPKEGQKGVTSLQVSNAYIGKIKKINSITVSIKKTDYISGLDVNFYGCDAKGTSTKNANGESVYQAVLSYDKCDNLKKQTIVEDGIQGTITLNFNKELDEADIQTLRGTVDYTYCYDVDVGSITVKPVGVQ